MIMTSTSKRKLTSSVAILCALMILIGIFPMNLFNRNKAEAAGSDTYTNTWLYFDTSNVSSLWNGTVYLNCPSWGTKQYEMTKIPGTNVYALDTSKWDKLGTSGEIYFSSGNLRTTNLGNLEYIFGNSKVSGAATNIFNVLVCQNSQTNNQYICKRENRYNQIIASGSSTINTKGDGIISTAVPTQGNSKPAHNPEKLYFNSTFYDYYSDYEIEKGENRKDINNSKDSRYDNTDGYGWTNTRYIQAQWFDRALSNFYSTNKVSKPLYFGHFQSKNSGETFLGISSILQLYGSYYNNEDTNMTWQNRNFFYYNNSEFRNSCNNCFDRVNFDRVNKHTHETNVAVQGLFGKKLNNGNITIPTSSSGVYGTDTGTVNAPYFDKAFLRGNNSYKTAYGNVYENVDFPFVKNSDGYWEFNSADANQTVRLKQTTSGEYYLDEVGSSGVVYGYTDGKIIDVPNFFPFNSNSDFTELKNISWNTTASVNNVNNPSGNKLDVQAKTNGTYVDKLNYGFGVKLEIPFTLNDTGKDQNGNDIVFNFSGDDDVLVYVDGKLALDLGGSHGAVGGNINFATKKTTVTKVKTSTAENSNVTKTFSELDLTAGKGSHTITLFYMERGIWESNMKITFNMVPETQLDVEKEVNTSNVDSDIQKAISDNVDKIDFNFDVSEAKTQKTLKETTTNNTTSTSYVITNDKNTITQTTYSGKSALYYQLNDFGTKGNYGAKIPFKSDGTTVDLSNAEYIYFWVYNTNSGYANNGPRIGLFNSNADDHYAIGALMSTEDVPECWAEFLSYNSNNNKFESGKWKQIKISISKLKENNTGINLSDVKYLMVSFWTSTKFYISDIGYASYVDESGSFTQTQKEYTLNTDTAIKQTSNEGAFTLENGDISHFVNQFDTGSSLKVHEADKYKYNNTEYNISDLFSTEWQLYSGKILRADSTASAYSSKNKYYADDNSTADTNAFKFSGSISAPDEVKFINSIKTQKLKITKKLIDSDGNPLTATSDKTFNFNVEFTNVGGINLENSTVTKQVNVTIPNGSSEASAEITGIPVGTNFNVSETNGDDYTVSYSPKTGTIVSGSDITVTVTNKEAPQLTEYTAIKNWSDGVPENDTQITLQLQSKTTGSFTNVKNGNVSIKKTSSGFTVAGGNRSNLIVDSDGKTWTYKYTDLPKKSGGNDITYRVIESVVPKGYEMTVIHSDNKSIITNTKIKTSVTVEKKWKDSTDSDMTDTSNLIIKLQLKQNGESYGNVITLDNKSGWKYTFNNLPKTDLVGKDYKYTIEEVGVADNGRITIDGKTFVVSYSDDGLTVTNKELAPIVMPEAGGEGKNPFNFVLFGAITIALAGGLLLLNKKYAFLHIKKSSKEVQ